MSGGLSRDKLQNLHTWKRDCTFLHLRDCGCWGGFIIEQKKARSPGGGRRRAGQM